MSLDSLLKQLEGDVTPVTSDSSVEVTPEGASLLDVTPVTSVTPENHNAEEFPVFADLLCDVEIHQAIREEIEEKVNSIAVNSISGDASEKTWRTDGEKEEKNRRQQGDDEPLQPANLHGLEATFDPTNTYAIQDKNVETQEHVDYDVTDYPVMAYTPAGNPLLCYAKTPEHAEWICKMNPPPTKENNPCSTR